MLAEEDEPNQNGTGQDGLARQQYSTVPRDGLLASRGSGGIDERSATHRPEGGSSPASCTDGEQELAAAEDLSLGGACAGPSCWTCQKGYPSRQAGFFPFFWPAMIILLVGRIHLSPQNMKEPNSTRPASFNSGLGVFSFCFLLYLFRLNL